MQTETVNKVCASGLRAVTLADQIIRTGDQSLIVAGGMESMSNSPYILRGARWGYRMGNNEVVDLNVADGLTCAFSGIHMGVYGGEVAKEDGISREAKMNGHIVATSVRFQHIMKDVLKRKSCQ